MCPDVMYLRGLRELAKDLTKPFSTLFQQFWFTGEVPADRKLATVMPIYRKGWKDDLRKVMEQIILSAITWHVQENQGLRLSQHGFMKSRSCFTNLISFYDNASHLVGEEKSADVVYPDFRKAFETVSHSTVLEKLAAHGLDGWT
ncbi:RNA-directed DNA polymerase from mobile element jockey-like protein [Turdus rufiventris]|nr:RNA-directed DNA polymerase from mobile element jockey-like protein [Turdus rufiventris]